MFRPSQPQPRASWSALLVVASLFASGTALAAVNPDRLVGHWRFDDGAGTTVRDSAGGNHGTLHGGKWTSGVSGSALRLEVSRDHVEIPADPSLEMTDELTIALWLRTESFDIPLVNKLQYWTPGNFDFRLERNGALVLGHEIGGGGRRQSRYESTVQLVANRWYHVAVTLRVGGEVRFYVDGEPAGTLPQTGTLAPTPAEPVRIGAKPDPYSSFRGTLDDLRLYRGALTAAEVKELAVEFQPDRAAPVATAAAGPLVSLRTTQVSAGAGVVDPAAHWPQWRGPRRDGKSTETGFLQSWPAAGPELLWFVEGLGDGFSTVAISEGRLFTTGMLQQQEVLFALDLHGRLLWHKTYGPAWHGRYPEARTTPTVDAGRVYVTSGLGRVVCFDARNGDELWAVDAAKEFDTKYHFWGIAESPLIVGDSVICTPCGTRATFAALDKKTGRVVWASRSLGEQSGYSSPISVAQPERTVFIVMLNQSIAGADAATGEILWRLMYSDYQTSPHGINPNTPVYHEGSFYTTSGYECGGALHALGDGGKSVTRRWAERTLDSHHGGVVLVDGHLYGANFRGHYAGNWVCLDWATGQVKYETKWICKGSVTYADGLLYCYEEKEGTVGLVRPTPEKFDVISSFKVPKGTGPHWAHPVICGGRLYIRHGPALMAYDIKLRP